MADQEKDPHSILNYFRKMVALRKSEDTLIYGQYTVIDEKNPAIYAFTRTAGDKSFLILLNFTAEKSTVNLGDLVLDNGRIIISNYPDATVSNELRGYEAIIIEY